MTAEAKRKTIKTVSNIILAVVLAVITILVIYPLFYVIATSLKDYNTYISNPFGLDFANLKFSNYADVMKSSEIFTSMINSVIISAVSVVLMVLWAALSSFGIGIVKFKGAGLIYFIAVSTMFFTGEMVYIPLYIMYWELGLLNTFWVLIIPYVIGLSGLGVIMGSGFIKQIPNEVHEAAFLDGAGLSHIFFMIDLPMLTPILAMVAIMQFQSSWSEFFWPLITVIGNKEIHPLPLIIISFNAKDASNYGQYCAGLTIMTVPIVVVYCFFSKYFMEGMAAGAVKG